MDKDGWNWDFLLPNVMFATWETPQVSTGFIPFELLFETKPWGLLDMVTETWEEQPSLFWTTNEHVKEMQDCINKVVLIVHEHMLIAQLNRAASTNALCSPGSSSLATTSSYSSPPSTVNSLHIGRAPSPCLNVLGL